MKVKVITTKKNTLALLSLLLLLVFPVGCTNHKPENNSGSQTLAYSDYIGNNTRIAVESGDAFGIVARNVFKSDNVQELPTVEDMLEALLSGEVDAALLSDGSSRFIMDSGNYPDFEYLTIPEEVYINRAAPVFHTEELRDKYNEWFTEIAADGTWQEITDRWIGVPLPKQEEIPQFEFTGENGVLKMCDTGSYAPLTYFDDNGNLTGFNVDMMSRFAQYMGMTLEIEVIPYEDVAEYVASGAAEMSACTLALTDERADSMIFGKPSTITQAVLIVKK
ncbi:MAG: transporter substrate-binding domain-containing protein [Oscillospiraceae bacterium]|nr:transporter substrate-binding domain-containing protein [Oscillospiraceae bacterium]